ncbi:hypothetical protein KCV87_00095 [Actinosynnema pretiosum subsp. pretiosum]|uniref:Uncharacterized protein n=1 Tax=Actinosynnema pretiosum subsp. pretiosum TaxID=103721 RepID=A0AA45R464_9PSEU|nr:hypothetical protein KCV87_00095 [Actinosynnema pretiosum subsp. pretiosum]
MDILRFDVFADSPYGRKVEDYVKLTQADISTLLSSCFVGNFEFYAGGVDFGSRGTGEGQLWMAQAFLGAIEALDSEKNSRVNFFDSLGGIEMRRSGAVVEVSAEHVNGRASIDFEKLLSLARSAFLELLSGIFEKYSDLPKNPAMFSFVADHERLRSEFSK